MFKQISGSYDDLWRAIIRPPRDEYTMTDLGMNSFTLHSTKIIRKDFILKNPYNQSLFCSHFLVRERADKAKATNIRLGEPNLNKQSKVIGESDQDSKQTSKSPCVIYLHGNSSSRLEALSCLPILLPLGISLFCFDFAGCGMSTGDFISLGVREKEDVKTVVNHIRKEGNTSSIGIWGRSMGAVTALMYISEDPSIAGGVFDSAFSDFRTLALELAQRNVKLPEFFLKKVLNMVRKTILKKGGVDIQKINALKAAEGGWVPSLFIAGKDDDFIKKDHTEKLYEVYKGDKKIVLCEGGHNDERPEFLKDAVGIFFLNCLGGGKKSENKQDIEEDKEEMIKAGLKRKKETIGNEEQILQELTRLEEKVMSEDEKLWAKLQTMSFNENEVWEDTNEFQKFEDLTEPTPITITEKKKMNSENLLDLDEVKSPIIEAKFVPLNSYPTSTGNAELLNIFFEVKQQQEEKSEEILGLDFFYNGTKN